MMMEAFYNKFPEIAEKETRCIIITNKQRGLPNGEYFLVESYCNDPKCDCRRVFINFLHKEEILATVGYGWESLDFYEKWIGEPDMAVDAKGPVLELTGPNTKYSETILRLFKEVILKDKQYIERLKRHYDMFKKCLYNKDDIEEDEELEDFNPEEHKIADLLEERGTGLESINDSNREAFYPIIMAIEETIWKHYSADDSLKDSDIIESLKNLRGNILSENAKFGRMEGEIVKKLKLVLFLNSYDKRDVSLSISSVLKSAKLHRSIDGSRGYLNFISRFFEQMKNNGDEE